MHNLRTVLITQVGMRCALGVSKHSREKRMRPHTQVEALQVLEIVEKWQDIIKRSNREKYRPRS